MVQAAATSPSPPIPSGARGLGPPAPPRQSLWLVSIALLALAGFVVPPPLAAIWGVLVENGTTKRVVGIDTVTGVVTSPYAGYSIGPFSTGSGARSGNWTIYFSANAPAEERRRLFAVDVATGTLLSSPLIGAPASAPTVDLLTTTPAFIATSGATVLGLFTLTGTTKCIAIVNPATGVVTQLGGAIPAGGFAGGVGAVSIPTNTVHFVAQDVGGAGPRLFGVNLGTGVLVASPLLTPPGGCAADPALLEADGAGRLIALFRATGGGWLTLATVDPDSGVAAALGPGFAASGYTSGVGDYGWGAQRLYIAANAPGETARRVFTLDTTTGALLSSPLITSAQGYLTTPVLLLAPPTVSSGPGAVPDGKSVDGVPLTVTKSGTNVVLSWGPSCSVGATDYSLHTGTIGSYYSHRSTQCTTGGARTTTTPMGIVNRYYLIVPVSATQEGSYGTDSQGVQRPVSSVLCLPTQNLSPCP